MADKLTRKAKAAVDAVKSLSSALKYDGPAQGLNYLWFEDSVGNEVGQLFVSDDGRIRVEIDDLSLDHFKQIFYKLDELGHFR